MKRSSLGDYVGIRTYDLGRGVFRSIVDRCPTLDSLATWLLGVSGLAVGFVFTNLDKVNKFLTPGTVHRILWLFGFCVAMGLLEKFFATRVKAVSEFDDQLNNDLKDVINSLVIRAGYVANISVDINFLDLQLSKEQVQEIDKQLIEMRNDVQGEYLKSVPWLFRWMIKRMIDAYNKDPLHVLKVAHREYCYQVITLVVQMIALFFALLIAARHFH